MTTQWMVCRARRPDAAVRLYCFPHSGGSTGEYVRWADRLPAFEVWAVQLPGRGTRLAEPPATRLAPLVDALLDDVRFAPPFVLFGHSLGALVAYEVALGLRERGRDGPECLVVSGYQAPHLPRTTASVHHLPDAELAAVLHDDYPMPPEIRDDPELLELVLPTYRADFEIVETYRYVAAEPLDCPIVVVAGDADRGSADDLGAWRQHTSGPCTVHLLPGDHFYLRDQSAALLRLVTETVAS